jgi:hypothetical protein
MGRIGFRETGTGCDAGIIDEHIHPAVGTFYMLK